jgi:hypothetical protein
MWHRGGRWGLRCHGWRRRRGRRCRGERGGGGVGPRAGGRGRCCRSLRGRRNWRRHGVGRYWPLRPAHREPARWAEAVLAAVDRRAARARRYARLAQHRHASVGLQGVFDPPYFRVDSPERCELAVEQVFALLAQAVHLEHQAAQIAVCQLARLAQEPQPPSQTAPLQEAGVLRGLRCVDACGLVPGRSLCWVCPRRACRYGLLYGRRRLRRSCRRTRPRRRCRLSLFHHRFMLPTYEGGAAGRRPAGRNGDSRRRRVSSGFGWAPRYSFSGL